MLLWLRILPCYAFVCCAPVLVMVLWFAVLDACLCVRRHGLVSLCVNKSGSVWPANQTRCVRRLARSIVLSMPKSILDTGNSENASCKAGMAPKGQGLCCGMGMLGACALYTLTSISDCDWEVLL